MSIRSLFPTLIHVAPLAGPRARRVVAALNTRLLAESWQLQRDDLAGQRWSKQRYPGGYTSYGSVCRLQELSPTFAELERRLQRHVRRFARALALDLQGRSLAMTDCWVNIMPQGVVHGLHLHPFSTLSGTCYLRTPAGSSGLKFEDPRLDRYMAAPPRRSDAPPEMQPWHTIAARPVRWCCSRAGCATRCRPTHRRPRGSACRSTSTGSDSTGSKGARSNQSGARPSCCGPASTRNTSAWPTRRSSSSSRSSAHRRRPSPTCMKSRSSSRRTSSTGGTTAEFAR